MIGEKIIGAYTNGNYKVILGSEGSKIRYNNATSFAPLFPETIDVNISQRCEQNCAFCYANCMPDGPLADLHHPIFNSIPPYVELALNGNGLEDNKDFIPFLERMRARYIICNLTLHLNQFIAIAPKVKYWHDTGLIHGIGVSISQEPTDEQLTILCSNPDIIVHVVAGIVTPAIMQKMYDRGLKVLILGYKSKGRGATYKFMQPALINQIRWLEDNLEELKEHFKVISFDNLAVEQLHLREHVSEEMWKLRYLGDDGQFSMYLNLCANTYARSSMDDEHPIFTNDIRNLFAAVRANI